MGVERARSRPKRRRRRARDYGRRTDTHEAFVNLAMIELTLNRLARPPGAKL
ncbi:MAG: hypothetical protein M0Z95_03470 [Actinomycetota bacterium]|nr:hypothetical protein [Actinomycetota bacterium]